MAFDKNDPKDMEIVQGMIDDAVNGLKTKNNELIRKLKKAEDPDKYNAEIERLEGEVETLKGKLTITEKDLKKTQTEFTSLQENHKALVEKDTATTISNALSKALDGVKVKPDLKKGVEAMLRNNLQLIDGKVMAGDKALDAYVQEWAKGDDAKPWIAEQTPNGGGGKGAGADRFHQFGQVKDKDGKDTSLSKLDTKSLTEFLKAGMKEE